MCIYSYHGAQVHVVLLTEYVLHRSGVSDDRYSKEVKWNFGRFSSQLESSVLEILTSSFFVSS